MAIDAAEATPGVAIALERAAAQLQRFARNHKAEAAHHRRLAQQGMEALAQLRRDCAAAGIHLVIDGQSSEGAETHGNRGPDQ